MTNEMCTKERPLCLNRPHNKGIIQFECDGTTEYTPINELTKLLNYAEDNTGNFTPEARPNIQTNINVNDCYQFDLAWFVVIEDIKRRYGILEKSNFDETKITEDIGEIINQQVEKNPIDLLNIFEKIVAVGKKRWEISNNQNCGNDAKDPDCLAHTIITEYQNLITDKAFINFCEKMKTMSVTPDDLTTLSNATPSEKINIIGPLKKMFTFTLPIMNSVGDLTNSLEETNVSEIKATFATILKLFKDAQSVSGGTKKKSRRRKKKSKKNKAKKKKLRSKKYRLSKSKGGLVGGGWVKTSFQYLYVAITLPLTIPLTLLGDWLPIDPARILRDKILDVAF